MSLPKQFAHHKVIHKIRFEDEDENVVNIDSFGTLQAVYRKGRNLTLGLPNNYTRYTIYFRSTATFSSYDYDYIFQWRKMLTFGAFGRSSVAYDLMMRSNELQSLRELRYISMTLQLHSYKNLRVKPFLENLPIVIGVLFKFGELSLEQIHEFHQYQDIPENFKVNVDIANAFIQYVRM